jgi:hypothetical protein
VRKVIGLVGTGLLLLHGKWRLCVSADTRTTSLLVGLIVLVFVRPHPSSSASHWRRGCGEPALHVAHGGEVEQGLAQRRQLGRGQLWRSARARHAGQGARTCASATVARRAAADPRAAPPRGLRVASSSQYPSPPPVLAWQSSPLPPEMPRARPPEAASTHP